MTEKVCIEHCIDYDYQRIRKALDRLLEPLGGMAAFVKQGEKVLLKPNMLAPRLPEKAVTTHPMLVRVVAEMVGEAGGQVFIGDSPGIGGFLTVAEKSGMAQAAKESGATLAPFDDSIEIHGTGTFKRIKIAKEYWEADKVINLPKLKTHEMMTLTCAVKNLFGTVVGAEKPAWHLKAGASREFFAQLLLEIYLLKKPALNIVDGILAMEGNGPSSGDPLPLGILIAGIDPVAVDLIAARLAGIPSHLLYVEMEAVKMGLPGSVRENIELVGSPPEDIYHRPFRLPDGLDTQFGLPSFLKKGLRRHLTTRPQVNEQLCLLCGACRDACPPQAITIKNSALLIDHGRCIRCWCCREFCPHDAMEVRKGALLKIMSTLNRFKRKG